MKMDLDMVMLIEAKMKLMEKFYDFAFFYVNFEDCITEYVNFEDSTGHVQPALRRVRWVRGSSVSRVNDVR